MKITSLQNQTIKFYASLKQNNLAEEKYLEPVYEFISLKRVPADDIIKQHC